MRKGNNQDFRRYVNGAKRRKVPVKQPVVGRSMLECAMESAAETLSRVAETAKECSREVAKIVPHAAAQLKDEARELRERLEEYETDQQDAGE